MADYRSEDPDGGFKKTFVAIAVVHLVLLGGLLLRDPVPIEKE